LELKCALLLLDEIVVGHNVVVDVIETEHEKV